MSAFLGNNGKKFIFVASNFFTLWLYKSHFHLTACAARHSSQTLFSAVHSKKIDWDNKHRLHEHEFCRKASFFVHKFLYFFTFFVFTQIASQRICVNTTEWTERKVRRMESIKKLILIGLHVLSYLCKLYGKRNWFNVFITI